MRKKKIVRKLISLGIASAGIGAAVLPVAAASPVLAAENVITQEDLDIKKAALDKAQAEYDEALKEQQVARDVVVNAERALEDAQEKYEYALESYPKGLAGFLQWVAKTGSKDTWEDEFKVVEAQQTLADLELSGYDEYYGDQMAGLFSFYDITDGIMGVSSSSTNLTRMYYSLDWMEEVAKRVSSGKLSDVRTSHGAMSSAMDYATFLSDDFADNEYLGTVGKVVDFKDWEVADPNDIYGGAHFYYMLLNNKGADISEAGIPQMDHYTGEFPERLTDLSVTNMFAVDYDEENDELIWDSEELTTENPIMGFALGTSNRGDFVVWTVAEEGVSNYLSTYSLDEYMQALRDYFSIADPESANLALINTDNDLTNAQKQLTMAEELLSVRAARLKSVQDDYEKAVAEFEAMPAEDTSEVLPGDDYTQAEQEGVAVTPVVQEEEVTITPVLQKEEVPVTPVLQEEVVAVSPVVINEGESTIPIVRVSDTDTAESAGVLSETPQAEIIQGNVHTPETENLTSVIGTSPDESIIVENETFAEEASSTVPVSYAVAESDAGEAESISEAASVVGEEAASILPDFVQENDVSSETVIKAEATAPVDEKQEKKEDSVLAEVLSYIFNGGAIAFIIPAGFLRRKSDKEILV